jgi:hypothetical protein
MDVNLIMKCRNVKNLNVDKAFVLQTIKDSLLVETNPEGTMIRRHGNKALPVMEDVDVPRKKVKGAAELVGVVYKVEIMEKKEGQPEMLWSQVKQAVKD